MENPNQLYKQYIIWAKSKGIKKPTAEYQKGQGMKFNQFLAAMKKRNLYSANATPTDIDDKIKADIKNNSKMIKISLGAIAAITLVLIIVKQH